MEFKVIKRNGNAVVPDGMFKLCGMEDVKLISMVQLNGGILLMPESVSTYQLLMLVDALNELACDFLEAVAIECGPAEEEHRGMTLDEMLSEFAVAVPDWARELSLIHISSGTYSASLAASTRCAQMARTPVTPMITPSVITIAFLISILHSIMSFLVFAFGRAAHPEAPAASPPCAQRTRGCMPRRRVRRKIQFQRLHN